MLSLVKLTDKLNNKITYRYIYVREFSVLRVYVRIFIRTFSRFQVAKKGHLVRRKADQPMRKLRDCIIQWKVNISFNYVSTSKVIKRISRTLEYTRIKQVSFIIYFLKHILFYKYFAFQKWMEFDLVEGEGLIPIVIITFVIILLLL